MLERPSPFVVLPTSCSDCTAFLKWSWPFPINSVDAALDHLSRLGRLQCGGTHMTRSCKGHKPFQPKMNTLAVKRLSGRRSEHPAVCVMKFYMKGECNQLRYMTPLVIHQITCSFWFGVWRLRPRMPRNIIARNSLTTRSVPNDANVRGGHTQDDCLE